MPQNVEGRKPVAEAKVVVIAEDEGDFFCLTDEDGAPRLFVPGDPVIAEVIEEAGQLYGADARTVTLAEFRALADDAE
ncbi:MAG: hypothetical protein ACRDNW_02025 [Trebonia sp.]